MANDAPRGLRFSLYTLLAYTTLWAVEAALVASRSIYALLPATLLGTSLVYVPIVAVCNRLPISRAKRRLLVSLSSAVVAVAVLIWVFFCLGTWR